MYNEGNVWVGVNDAGEKITLLPKMANRHGLVAGATGTGKTVTLKVLAESFSDMGVPVFMADVKGDIAGISIPGDDSENMQERIARFGLVEAGFSYKGYPVTLWDIYGEKGVTLRTTISEIGQKDFSGKLYCLTAEFAVLHTDQVPGTPGSQKHEIVLFQFLLPLGRLHHVNLSVPFCHSDETEFLLMNQLCIHGTFLHGIGHVSERKYP